MAFAYRQANKAQSPAFRRGLCLSIPPAQRQEQLRPALSDWRVAMPALLQSSLNMKQERHTGSGRPENTNIICDSFACVNAQADLGLVAYKWEDQPDS